MADDENGCLTIMGICIVVVGLIVPGAMLDRERFDTVWHYYLAGGVLGGGFIFIGLLTMYSVARAFKRKDDPSNENR